MSNQARHISPFNGPVECGVRALVILWAERPTPLSIQRMVIYDYLLVHSGDLAIGGSAVSGTKFLAPPSLHPDTPNRGGEILVRRQSLAAGVQMLIQKGLVVPVFDRAGVSFAATEIAVPFLSILEAPYLRELLHRAEWVSRQMHSVSDDELATFSLDNARKWGSEFIYESALGEK